MKTTEFMGMLDELFELPSGSISLNDRLADIDGWGSLTFIGLIGMVDERCGVTLSPTAVEACESVQDLIRLVGPAISDRMAA